MSCIEIVGAVIITIILGVAALEEHGEDLTPVENTFSLTL